MTGVHWVHEWKPGIPLFLPFYVKSHQEHRVHGLCLQHAKSSSWGCPWQSQLTTGTMPSQGQMADCLGATAISQPEPKGTDQALGNCHQLEWSRESHTVYFPPPWPWALKCKVSSSGSCAMDITQQEPAHTSVHVPPQCATSSASLQGNNLVNPQPKGQGKENRRQVSSWVVGIRSMTFHPQVSCV